MSRQPVSMRQATLEDVPFLVELWSDVLRKADRQEQVGDLEIIVKEAAESAEKRLLVAEYDGEPAGALLLRVTPMTPLNLEPTVQALAPTVTPSFRGKGIGSALMESAVLWAEELGVSHITTAAASSSRSGNRFMARLSLGPQAVLRASATPLVRAKLAAMQPTSVRISDRQTGRRHLGQVLAARRQLSRRTSEDTGRTGRADRPVGRRH
jgi:GNAT superfamily N-acetyltransferase